MIFVEELEPQVRDAVLVFNRKGYSTLQSGFWGEHGELQCIEGEFAIDEETRNRLLDTMPVDIDILANKGEKIFTSINFTPL